VPAVVQGVLPFLALDVLKASLAAAVAVRVRGALEARRGS